MLDRLILGAVMGVTGWHGLFPNESPPLTPPQLQAKAKEKSISAMCDKRPKSKVARDLCKRWERSR